MRNVLIGGTHSGCGKTTVACAVLRALVNRGMNLSAFKCGPDYIDPMFHGKIIGVPSRNLDLWFCGENMLNYIVGKNSGEMSVTEGVMGFYDGIGEDCSSHAVALKIGAPAILVIDSKGMSLSLGAVMEGFLKFREPNNIKGFIFNRLPESLTPLAKRLCEELGTKYFGRLPYKKELSIESRNLGLVTAGETENLKEKLNALAALAEENILIDDIIKTAEETEQRDFSPPPKHSVSKAGVRIALARDEAFCFYYEDNLDLFKEMGCEIAEFSPLKDTSLPEGADALILGGGYPELHAEALSQNTALLRDIHEKIASGLPTIAECGGFMYLHDKLGGYDMAGIIRGEAFKTESLRRFGYAEINMPDKSVFGACRLKAHEFHYWDSTDAGCSCRAERARGGVYGCAHTSPHLYAGFPHLYLPSAPEAAENFVKKCMEYKNAKNRKYQAPVP